MTGDAFLFVLSLLFCGWQMVFVVAQADLHESFDSRRWGHRWMVRRDMRGRSIFMAIGLVVAIASGYGWVQSGARLATVAGTALMFAGITFVLCLLLWETGRASRKQRDPKPAVKRTAALWLVEFFVDVVLDQ